MKNFVKLFCGAALIGMLGCQGNDAHYYENKDDDLYSKGKYQDLENKVGNTVYFSFNSDDLSEEARMVLERQAEFMNNYLKKKPTALFTIEGHCDKRGTIEYNLALGERRADSVKKFLVSEGVPSNKINVVSFGKDKPAVVGDTEEDFKLNRRAVTVIR